MHEFFCEKLTQSFLTLCDEERGNEMDKEHIFVLLQPVNVLKGIGEKTAKALNDLSIVTIYDLMTHFPRRYEDIKPRQLHSIQDQEKVTLKGMVVTEPIVNHYGFKKNRLYFRMALGEDVITVSFFNQFYLKQQIQLGEEIALYGKWDARKKSLTAIKIIGKASRASHEELNLEAVYRTNRSIRQANLIRYIQQAFQEYGSFIFEPLPTELRQKYGFITYAQAMYAMHFPKDSTESEQARQQLIYQELFIYQLALQMRLKKRRQEKNGQLLKYNNQELKAFIQTLPFELTADQKKVVNEICYDLLAPYEMNRLLQGDVGSGKTIVAVLTMVATALANAQSVLMVPTEILANQHVQSIEKLLKKTDLRVEKLTSSTLNKEREQILADLASGKIHLLVGTHAVFQPDVCFKQLGFVVIDEQHRFGVKQRKAITEKGQGVNVLQMTATPIPRTLAITTFGEMDVSVLKEVPKGRKPIRTYWAQIRDMERVLEFVKKEILNGRQAYIVSPLIEESETLDIKNAEEVYQTISQKFQKDIQIGLLHGRLKTDEKDRVMESFQQNEIQLLVATTVIEVGVDVPNATIMVILDADRFGLAQLHQLRGRVGRGNFESYCFILASPKTENGKKRMKIMCESTDGFYLSEQDLQLRGAGDVLGTKQSGFPEFSIADVIRDYAILEEARKDAIWLATKQSQLLSQNKELLWLVDYQQKESLEV